MLTQFLLSSLSSCSVPYAYFIPYANGTIIRTIRVHIGDRIGSPGKNGTYWKLIEGRLVVIFMQSYFRDPSKYPRA